MLSFCRHFQEYIRARTMSPANKRVIDRLKKFEGVSDFCGLYLQSQGWKAAEEALNVLIKYARDAVCEKSVSTRTFGTNERWTNQHLVITRNGTMMLFDRKNAVEPSASFNLTKKTQSDFVENYRMWNFNMQNEEDMIQIAFQSADDLHESLDSIKRFIGDILQEHGAPASAFAIQAEEKGDYDNQIDEVSGMFC